MQYITPVSASVQLSVYPDQLPLVSLGTYQRDTRGVIAGIKNTKPTNITACLGFGNEFAVHCRTRTHGMMEGPQGT